MGWKFSRKEPERKPVQRAPPKKNACKIKFKKTANGEEMQFSPECTPAQVEMAKEMRRNREGED